MYIPVYTGLFLAAIAIGNLIWLARIQIKEIKADMLKRQNLDVYQIVPDADRGKTDDNIFDFQRRMK